MKQKVRLTESQLHNVIKESVKQVLSEQWDRTRVVGDYDDDFWEVDTDRNKQHYPERHNGKDLEWKHNNRNGKGIDKSNDYEWHYEYEDGNGRGLGKKWRGKKEPSIAEKDRQHREEFNNAKIGDKLSNGEYKMTDNYACKYNPFKKKLSEAQLKQVIMESVNKVLSEWISTPNNNIGFDKMSVWASSPEEKNKGNDIHVG